jgi:heptosyltransferase-3
MTPPRSVLVVITRRIGDVLLATPVIRSLKHAWPGAAVDVLVFAGTGAILDHNPDVARVISIPERPALREHLHLLAQIRRRYDLALSLLPGDRPSLYAWLAGRVSAGLVTTEAKQGWKRALLTRCALFDPLHTHTVAMHLALADALGIPRQHAVAVHWSDEDEARARRLLPFNPDTQPFAVLHCSPKFNYKMWRREGWIELGRHLAERGLQVVLSGGGDAREMAYARSVGDELPKGTVNVAGELALTALGFVLSRARLYAGPDTAVTHMAAGLGTPTVALYGPTNAAKWGPWPHGCTAPLSPWKMKGSQQRGNVWLLQGTGRCVPCTFEGCERRIESFSDCLQTLPASRVIAAVDDMLRERRG